jgi:hypothetical protein
VSQVLWIISVYLESQTVLCRKFRSLPALSPLPSRTRPDRPAYTQRLRPQLMQLLPSHEYLPLTPSFGCARSRRTRGERQGHKKFRILWSCPLKRLRRTWPCLYLTTPFLRERDDSLRALTFQCLKLRILRRWYALGVRPKRHRRTRRRTNCGECRHSLPS